MELLNKLLCSVLAFDEFSSKLAESDKSLEAACAEIVSSKEQVVRVNAEKVDTDKIFIKDFEELEQRMVHLNATLVGCSRVKMFARWVVKVFLNEVNGVVQQLRYDAVHRLRDKLKGAY